MRLRWIAALAAISVGVPAGTAQAQEYFDVGKLPLPPMTGAQIASDLEQFVGEYSPRVTGTPQEQAAGEFLRAEAEALGYKTETVLLPTAGAGDPEAPVLRAIVAIKPGLTKPDEHLMFMGHYDTVAGFGGVTVEGAYDNGSGTNMMRQLVKTYATIPTNRSIAFVYYNGEEEGVLASQRHAEMWKAAGTKVRAVLGFDMVGIAWPVGAPDAASCLCIWHGDGDEDLEALIRHVNFGVLGFPDDSNAVSFEGVNARNSDESSWDEDNLVLRWAGRRTAASYPAYHMPDDTIEKIDEVAGGRPFFEQGSRNTLVSAYLTAMALDNAMPTAKASSAGTGTVTFDAAGSSDPDGPPSAITWEFGDGAAAAGSTVTHTYTKPGVYTARLKVSDNLWPHIMATAEVPVTVPAKKAKKKKPTCRQKAAKIKNTKKRKAAQKRCAKAKKKKRRG